MAELPEEQREILDWSLAAHHRGHEDASGTVVGNFLGRGESHEVALLIFELRVGIGFLFLEEPFELGVLPRGVRGVVGAEAGEGLMLGQHDGARVAAAFDNGTKECGNRNAALGVDRVQSAALKQML